MPVVVGALGSTLKKPKNCIEELGVVINTALLQKTALLETARILRKVLDCVKVCRNRGRGGKKCEEREGTRVQKTELEIKNVKG